MLTSQEGGVCQLNWGISLCRTATDNELISQATRVRALQTAYRKAEFANPRDNAPKAGAIRNLGLLDKEEDTKAVLGK